MLQLEIQSSRDASLPGRMPFYSVLLTHRYEVPVRSVMILLRPEADGRTMTGVLTRELTPETPYLEFRYEVLRVWQLPIDAILVAGIGTLPLAPLTAGAADRFPEVVDQVERRLDTGVQSNEASDLWTATYILSGLSYDAEILPPDLTEGANDDRIGDIPLDSCGGPRKGSARGS